MDAAVGRRSLFFTCTAGIQKIDLIANTPIHTGLTKGLDVRAVTTGTGGGFAGGFTKMAYHITWNRTDANNQLIRSDVSSRCLLTNNTQVSVTTLTQTSNVATATCASAHGYTTVTVTSSTTFTYVISGSPVSPAVGTITASKSLNVNVSFTVPWDVGSADYYEVWRTVTTPASNSDPGDDCFLVSATLNTNAAGSTITFTDTTSDTTLSALTPLYTNSTQEGALAGNSRPLVASCIATYKDYQIYGLCRCRQRSEGLGNPDRTGNRADRHPDRRHSRRQ